MCRGRNNTKSHLKFLVLCFHKSNCKVENYVSSGSNVSFDGFEENKCVTLLFKRTVKKSFLTPAKPIEMRIMRKLVLQNPLLNFSWKRDSRRQQGPCKEVKVHVFNEAFHTISMPLFFRKG